MNLTRAQADFLSVLSCALHQAPAQSLPAQPEWFQVFSLAEKHHLLPVIFDYVRRCFDEAAQPAMFPKVKPLVISQIARHISSSSDTERIYRALRQQNLHPLALKGALCASLYPAPDTRITADLDLLIREDEFTACHQCLIALGLSPDCSDEALYQDYEVSYFSADHNVCIELHRALFSDAEGILNQPFSNAFQTSCECDGYLTLSPENHFLFLIFHAFKHFIHSGVGIRQICDIGLWAREYGDTFNWPRLRTCCANANADIFAACLFRIARERLAFTVPCPEDWMGDCEDIIPLLLDVLEGGVYGSESLSRLHTSTATLNAVRSNLSGQDKEGLLRSVFPERAYLVGHYPYLKEHPLLLPVAWASRLCRYASETRRHKDSSASESIRLAKKRLQLLRDYKILR